MFEKNLKCAIKYAVRNSEIFYKNPQKNTLNVNNKHNINI